MRLGLSKEVEEFIDLLEKHDVRYLLIGGHAVIFHGYPRLTGDTDLAYAPDHENASRLWAALTEFWGGAVPVVRDAEELEEEGMIFQFGRPPNRIDLLSQVPGIDFGAAWERRVTWVTPSGPVALIGLYDLRCAKRAAGRPKDREDLQQLPKARKPRT